ncbi:MAG TPA: SEC-C domain-containing protein [Candidatus Angelobacter sp.]
MPQRFATEKLGRNDLCSCGSGKKYKHCCLANAVSADAFWSRANSEFHELTKLLVAFALEHFAPDIEDAWDDFHFGATDSDYAPGNDIETIFMPYFLYRWRDLMEAEPGDTWQPGAIATSFLREKGRILTPMQTQLLFLCMHQPITFYDVLESRPGQGMLLREIFTGREYDVRERSASRSLNAGDILYAQMSPVEGLTTMAFCAPVPIPPRMKSMIIAQRVVLQSIGKKRKKPRIFSTDDLLEFEEDFRELYLEIGDRLNAPPVLHNTDGDPLEMHTMKFELRLSPADAFELLAPLLAGVREKEDVLAENEDGASDEPGTIAFDWYKKGNKKMKSWDNTILGHLKLSPGLLVADVNSRRRAEKLRWEIENRLRLGVVHKQTSVQTSEDLLEKVRRMPPEQRQEDAAQAKLMKDPAARAALRDFLQKETDAWIHKKLPALGGRTPLQAVKDPDMREIVESLLLDFERHAATDYPPGAAPDFSEVRKRLGVPVRKGAKISQ